MLTHDFLNRFTVFFFCLPFAQGLNSLKLVFHLANLFARTEKKSNLIGWRQTLTTSPANHIRFLLVRANKFAKWKTGLMVLMEHRQHRGQTFAHARVVVRAELSVRTKTEEKYTSEVSERLHKALEKRVNKITRG